ncbi:MAG: DUF1697 domain-containing protein [Bacteroidota bacterium]
MIKRIAILRAINVGGKRKILMADLKVLFKDLEFCDIKTYIQSGNVIFSSIKEITDNEISQRIENAISEKYEFDVPVIIRKVSELEQVILSNSFYQEKEIDVKKLHLTFLKEKPSLENRLKTEAYDYSPDKFVINDKNVFIFCDGKYHQSKLTNNFFENKLKVSATTRNWKTVLKLLELSKTN